jgi:hypothetical protein
MPGYVYMDVYMDFYITIHVYYIFSYHVIVDVFCL